MLLAPQKPQQAHYARIPSHQCVPIELYHTVEPGHSAQYIGQGKHSGADRGRVCPSAVHPNMVPILQDVQRGKEERLVRKPLPLLLFLYQRSADRTRTLNMEPLCGHPGAQSYISKQEHSKACRRYHYNTFTTSLPHYHTTNVIAMWGKCDYNQLVDRVALGSD